MSEFEFSFKSTEFSDLLSLDGPLVEVWITAPLPLVSFLADNDYPPYAVCPGMALIDTGAASSVVDESAMEQLAIPYINTIPVQTAHGVAEMRRYNASMSLPGLGMNSIPLHLAPAGMLRADTYSGADIIMLLGRDFLKQLIVTYDGPSSSIKVHT